MCGITGILDWRGGVPSSLDLLKRMLGLIQHRGPDEFGIYLGQRVGLGNARLSIIDLSTGQQPITNEDHSCWIVFNGEIYNYLELRSDLIRAGHQFTTQSDTEVILHLYEEYGPACLQYLNGQFAIAIWDDRRQELFLARDRLGIRPLFYTQLSEGLVFASEIKAVLLHPEVQARLNPRALAQAFTFWSPQAPLTVFDGIFELPPGHYMWVGREGIKQECYWALDFPAAGEASKLSMDEAAQALHALLMDATRLRLRADVTVGSYLSGGLDSTLIAALIREQVPDTLCTFSVSFEESAFDERPYQERATDFLRTQHQITNCTNAEIGRIFPEVVWHSEAPLLRTSPAPMYVLSRLVHEAGIKVVLTGEGADEFFGGYNIFKEDKVRRFWARDPESNIRPLLLRRLYPYVADLSGPAARYLMAFFRRDLEDVDRRGYSHTVRWHNTRQLQRFFAPDLRSELNGYDPVADVLAGVDPHLPEWSHLSQAQYLEIRTFMSSYLLSSQGDRMMAANSVEGRFPFLDHRVVEFANHLAPSLKLRGLQEKFVLRKTAAPILPREISQRRKQPYRAPIHASFLQQAQDGSHDESVAYVNTLLSPRAIEDAGVFNAAAVSRLLNKLQQGGRISEREDMALVGVLSTQLLHHLFVDNFADRVVAPVSSVRVES